MYQLISHMLSKKCVKCGKDAFEVGFVEEGGEIPTTTITTKGPYCNDCRKELQKKKSG